jgi:hypothetical protein
VAENSNLIKIDTPLPSWCSTLSPGRVLSEGKPEGQRLVPVQALIWDGKLF